MNRLKLHYQKEVIPTLRTQFGYRNSMEVPRLTKVIVQTGIGKLVRDGRPTEKIAADLAIITGQKAASRAAKKSIAGFKLRQGMGIGLMVTLRGERMYDFIDRLIAVALPRSRDFQGLSSKALDQTGNLNIGIKEHTIFPEVSYESLRDVFGFQVTIVTTAKNKKEAEVLYTLMGFPLKAHI